MTRFKMPPKEAPEKLEEWVKGKNEPDTQETAAAASETLTGGKAARLTIDLPQDLHAKFKSICALKKTRMVDEVRQLIEDWTQKNG